MKDKTPFHYEVRFRLIAYDSDNNYSFPSYTKKCINSNPLKVRIEAFEIFDEYLIFPDQKDRLKINKRGNYVIENLQDIKYRTLSFTDVEEMKGVEREIKGLKIYMYNT